MIETPTPPRHPLLKDSAGLKLFLMLRRLVDAAALPVLVDKHLQWMIGQEKAGTIVLSGPIDQSEGAALQGATVVRANSLAEADSIVRKDPFVEAGAISFDLHAWTVYEGAIPVTLSLSDGRVNFR
jgi:uncharacterized protein YciI